MPTGLRSGLLVVDIDPGNGGNESWKRIRAGRKIPITAQQITGGGGRHITFQHPGGRVPKTLGPGVDSTGDGGYIVVEPSLHASGHRYRFDGPFFILVLQGEQGSAKSTTARILRRLIDPTQAPLRTQPRELRDLTLCSFATGGGFTTRQLYSDDQETIFDATRPILLNGIDSVAVRGDLLDRALLLDLPVIPPNKRRTEEEVWQKFDETAPQILGALLDAVVQAVRNKSTIELPELPRMADAVKWAAAGGVSVG